MKKIIAFLFFILTLSYAVTYTDKNVVNITQMKNAKCGSSYTLLKNFPSPFEQMYAFGNTLLIPYDLRCPSLSEIKKNNPTLVRGIKDLKNAKYRVIIKSFDFDTGTYVCSYHFNDYQFNIVKTLKECQKFNEEFEKGFKFSKYGKLNLPPLLLYKVGDIKLAQAIDVKKIYNTFYDKTLELAKKMQIHIIQNPLYQVNLRAINSHSNYEKTFPAVITAMLTLDTDYLNPGSQLVDEFGKLNVNLPTISNPFAIIDTHNIIAKSTNDSFLSSLFGGDNTLLKDEFSNNKELMNYVENKDKYINKTFWGFYFYFFKNVEMGFRQIIEIIFFFGAVGLFGLGIAGKKINFISTELTQRFQFDFSRKFIGISTAFIMFTTPIFSTSNAKIDPAYLYNPNQTEAVNSYTPVQGFMRFSLQLGNYFGNILADYGSYAYLKYITSQNGYAINATSALSNLNNFMKDLYKSVYDLKRKDDFLYTLCYASYPMTIKKNRKLPNNVKASVIDIYDTNNLAFLQTQLFQKYGFMQVDYNFCLNLQNEVDYQALMIIKNLENFLNTYQNTLNKFSNTNNYDRIVTHFNDVLKTYIQIHNNFGWLATIALPNMEQIFSAMALSQTLNINDIKAKVASQSFKLINPKYLKDYGGYEIKKEDLKVSHIDDNSVNNLIFGQGIQFLSSVGIYYILPGFEKMMSITMKIIEGGGQSLTDWLSSGKSYVKLLKNVPFFGNKIKLIHKLLKSFYTLAVFAFAFFVVITLYKMLIATLNFILVAFALIIKVSFYFLEIFITYLISFALSIWALFNNPQKTWEAWSNFTFHVAKLTFSPMLIVLSVFAVIIVDKLIYFFFSIVSFIISNLSYTALYSFNELFSTTDITNFKFFSDFGLFLKSVYNYVIINSFVGSSQLILELLIIIINILIIMRFTEWAFEIFGRRESTSLGGEIKQINEFIKKYSGGMM